jgi:PAS domain S-box-containing protein
MTKANQEKKLHDKDWLRVDARILGQILAAQNVLFVLPDETRIAEYFTQAMSCVPGISSCFVCLGNHSVQTGESQDFCNECVFFQKKESGSLILPVNFTCGFATRQEMRILSLKSNDNTFGFFIFQTDATNALEPYWPFLSNLANYVALSLENRMQKHLLEKSRNDMEERVRKRTEELKLMNERFLLATHAARLGVWDWDIQKNELVWDDGMYKLYGIKKDEFAGAYEAWLNGLHPDDRINSEEMSKLARQGEKDYDTEFRVVWPDGSTHYLKAFGQIVRDSDGNPLRMTGINFDITERKLADEATRKSEKEFRTLAENIPDNIIRYDLNCRAIYVNHMSEIPKYFTSTIIDKTPTDNNLEGISGIEAYAAKLQRVIETGKTEVTEIILHDLQGNIHNYEVGFVAEYNSEGQISGALAIGRDITERKQVEATLAKTTDQLNEAQRIVHIGSWELDIVHNVLTWSDEIYRMFEIDPDAFDASYETFLNAIHPDDRDAVNYAYTNSLKTRIPYTIDHRLLFADGRIKYVHEQCETFYDETGKPIRSLGIVQDITERKKSEAAVQESDMHYHQIVDLSQDMIVIHQQGKVVFVNEAGAQLLGVSKSDKLIGRSVLEFVPPEYRKIALERMQTGVTEKGYKSKVYEQKMIRCDGSVIDIELRGMPILYLGEQAIQFIARDITARKQAEQRLILLNFALNNVYDEAYLINEQAGFDYVNDGACRALGYSSEELLRMNVAGVDPDFPIGRWSDHWHDIREHGSLIFEGRHLTKDGRIYPVEISANYFEFNGQGYNLAMVRDISGRKQAEEEIRKLNQELEQRVADRTLQLELANKELEAFSYSVSHDLRAPLRSIDGFSLALLEDYHDKIDEQGKNYLKRVRTSTQRMAQLIDDMLKLSRVSRSEMNIMRVNLSNMFREIASELHESQPQRKIGFIIQEDIQVLGDSRLLRIVLVNLIENAFKFTSKHTVARIEFGMQLRNNIPVYFVRDDGAGFDMNHSQKLFGAFQRLHTSSEFPGTGIGLATVQRVIHRHDGNVWAEGEIEKGATFYFTLHLQKE